jgi:hypothetical protein
MEKVKDFFGALFEQKKETVIVNKRIIQLLWVMAGIHILVMLMATFNQSLWMDEAYTLTVLKDVPFGKLFSTVLSVDYQPPLYYFIGKGIMMAIMTIAPIVTDVTAAKIVSVIPCILLVVLSATKIRKRFGGLTASLFAFCMTAMPQIMHYGVEIRTYSWSMLCVTVAFVFAYDAMDRGKAIDWILFTLTAIAAVYTHYFALMAVFFIYVFCALWFFINKKYIKLLPLVGSGVILLSAFLPCLLMAFKIFSSIVSTESWYGSIGLKVLAGFIAWPFDPLDGTPMITLTSIFTWVSLLSYVVVVFVPLFVFHKEKPLRKLNPYYANAGFLVMFGVIALACIIGWILKPWFIIRYAFPAIGAFWLCFCIGVINFPVKHRNACVIVFCMMMSAGNILGFVQYEYQIDKSFDTFMSDFASQVNEKDVVIASDNEHFNYCFNEILPVERVFTYRMGDESRQASVFPKLKRIDLYDECTNYLTNENRYVYIELTNTNPGFGSSNTEAEFLDWIKSKDIPYELVGNYSFEVYSFKMYRINAADLIYE